MSRDVSLRCLVLFVCVVVVELFIVDVDVLICVVMLL